MSANQTEWYSYTILKQLQDLCPIVQLIICLSDQHRQERTSVYLHSPYIKKLNSNANLIENSETKRQKDRKCLTKSGSLDLLPVSPPYSFGGFSFTTIVPIAYFLNFHVSFSTFFGLYVIK
jgi:hypothetical protein